jgi:hypothetical protein
MRWDSTPRHSRRAPGRLLWSVARSPIRPRATRRPRKGPAAKLRNPAPAHAGS